LKTLSSIYASRLITLNSAGIKPAVNVKIIL
jgi:hypothetical protein